MNARKPMRDSLRSYPPFIKARREILDLVSRFEDSYINGEYDLNQMVGQQWDRKNPALHEGFREEADAAQTRALEEKILGDVLASDNLLPLQSLAFRAEQLSDTVAPEEHEDRFVTRQILERLEAVASDNDSPVGQDEEEVIANVGQFSGAVGDFMALARQLAETHGKIQATDIGRKADEIHKQFVESLRTAHD